MELIRRGINPIGFEGLKTSVTTDDSRSINEDPKPKVILSASGMCDAGRIKHHLKHNPGGRIDDSVQLDIRHMGRWGGRFWRAENIKLFGEEIEVKAEICRLPGVSGHAIIRTDALDFRF